MIRSGNLFFISRYSDLGIITLEGLEFFAYHGYYSEEQKIGNRYSLDVAIETDLDQAGRQDVLSYTVDYVVVYQVVAAVMKQSHKLLEHIGYKVISEIRLKYPFVEKVRVSVSKYNPPIGGVCDRARITLEG